MEDSASKQVVPDKVNLLTLEKLKVAIINSELVLSEFQRPDVWGDPSNRIAKQSNKKQGK